MPIHGYSSPDIHAYYAYTIQIRWRTVDPDLDAYANDQWVYAFGSWSAWTCVPLWTYTGRNGNAMAWATIEYLSSLPQQNRGGTHALNWRVQRVLRFR
jgi:hypothetical protein